MVDRNGGVLCAEPRPLDYIGSSVRGYPHIGEALEQGKPVVSDLHIVKPSGKKVISVPRTAQEREMGYGHLVYRERNRTFWNRETGRRIVKTAQLYRCYEGGDEFSIESTGQSLR